MKPASPLLAAAATISLHAALIGVAVTALSDPKQQLTAPSPLAVQIVQEPPSPPVAAPVQPQPSPAPVAQEKNPPKPRDRRQAAPKPQPAPEPQEEKATTPRADSTPEAKPAPSNPSPAVTAPVAPEAAVPSQAATAAPARTRASDANYAASNRRPPYPRLSQAYNEEGTVLLRVLVKADGTAGAVEIKKSSGYPLLDKSASTTVQTWRFTPATVNGKPVDEWYEVPIPFKLQNN